MEPEVAAAFGHSDRIALVAPTGAPNAIGPP